MKRWLFSAVNNWLVGCAATVLALGAMSGCQPVFMSEQMYKDMHVPLPGRPDQNDALGAPPITAMTPTPATVNNADRRASYMTLQEAMAIALENGHVSSRAGPGAGVVDSQLLSFNGASSLTPGQIERVRALALNPALAQAAMEHSLSRFDAFFLAGMTWTSSDGLAGIPNLGGSLQNSSLFTSPGNGARFESAIVKPLPSGGIGAISFSTDYRQFSSPAFLNANGINQGNVQGLFNPQYSTRISFGFEQPLMKDFGVFMNQLLPRFPSSNGLAFDPSISSGLGSRQGALSSFVDRNVEGILISRLRSDQARAEFERNIHILLTSTEVAYWNLYNKYGQLYSVEENLRIMHSVWQISYNRYQAGSKNMGPADYFQILAQYEEFRGERLRALQEVLDAERNLRGLLGMPVEDGERIVPITEPNMTELKVNWASWLHDALNLRPELVLARDNIRYHQHLLSLQYNNLRPDLRLVARYEPFGDGSTLSGSGTIVDGTGTSQPTNSFRSLASGKLADWQIGLNLTIPLGYRAEYAAIRGARLELTQAFYLLRDQEDRATRFLAEQHQQLAHWWKRIEAHRSERLRYNESLKVRYEKIKAGGSNIAGGSEEPPQAFLDTQRRYSAALVKEYEAISQYNATLARLEWAKGTILQYNNIHISEGALPQCAQVRAVENEKERSKSLVLREKPSSLDQPGRWCVTKEKDLPSPDQPSVVETKAFSTVAPPMSAEKSKVAAPIYQEKFGVAPLPTQPGKQVEQVAFRPAPGSTIAPMMPALPQLEIPDSTLSLPKLSEVPARMPVGGPGFATTEEAAPPSTSRPPLAPNLPTPTRK